MVYLFKCDQCKNTKDIECNPDDIRKQEVFCECGEKMFHKFQLAGVYFNPLPYGFGKAMDPKKEIRVAEELHGFKDSIV
jgi:hypothetical protein